MSGLSQNSLSIHDENRQHEEKKSLPVLDAVQLLTFLANELNGWPAAAVADIAGVGVGEAPSRLLKRPSARQESAATCVVFLARVLSKPVLMSLLHSEDHLRSISIVIDATRSPGTST